MIDLTIIFIVSSVVTCFIAGGISAIIILNREVTYEAIFFSLFLLGTSFYVFLYLFLAVESLRYVHYPLEMIAMEIATFGSIRLR